jgi:hypothetical protein
MKYIITEEQFKTAEQAIREYRLEKTIIKFFDDNLTPEEGWESHEDYESEIEINGGELFLRITDDDEWDLHSDNHMWYSICDNDNLSEPLDEGHCPVVTLPKLVYDALDGYFGSRWKELFRRWFKTNTGLRVVQIDLL